MNPTPPKGFEDWAMHPVYVSPDDDVRWPNGEITRLTDWESAYGLTPPSPPWKSPLPFLPDLTEHQCVACHRLATFVADEAVLPSGEDALVQIGRALIAAGWKPS